MNTPHDPSDTLLQSLIDEAADLPARAAREARHRNARRVQRRLSIALAVTVLFLGASAWRLFTKREANSTLVALNSSPPQPAPDLPTWSSKPSTTQSSPEKSIESSAPSPTPRSKPELSEFVKVQTEEETMRHPLPLPEGLDQEQQELFKAARGLPLLLVRDSTGKVARIHVI